MSEYALADEPPASQWGGWNKSKPWCFVFTPHQLWQLAAPCPAQPPELTKCYLPGKKMGGDTVHATHICITFACTQRSSTIAFSNPCPSNRSHGVRLFIENHAKKIIINIFFLIHGWCPQRERRTLSSEEWNYFIYFMKSDLGSLALWDINFSHGEERVFEMHLRLGPWMVYFLLFLGHLALGTYHLCLRISALTFGDVCWIPSFLFSICTCLP